MSAVDALAEAIDVMATLRGPGGCPWDAQQTHKTLTKYAIEEAFEVSEAAETGTVEELKEELGDLLLQVLFHAEIARESGDFTLADVATTLVGKLRRRHPHVFGDVQAHSPQEVERNWAEIKREENPNANPFEGIPVALPALMRAQKVLNRAQKANLIPAPEVADAPTPESIGAELLAVVEKANDARIDAEQALRGATRALQGSIDLPPTQ